ncbi:MAG: hypothetical protein M3N17_07935 [Actinomycetota bacterium]|nr:hypothetical protein [Actinomycetota bacterium]
MLLLAAGLAMVLWRPCRWGQGRAPRSAIASLLAAAGAIWTGSLGVVVGVVSGEFGGTLAACGVLWRQMLTGQLAWWEYALVGAWIVALPGRGLRPLVAGGLRSRQLLGKLKAAGVTPSADTGSAARTFVAPGLSTTAITLGVLRPAILVDAAFWCAATEIQRQVVLAHEDGHRRGHHVVVDGAARALTAGLRPLPTAGWAYDCVRRHLEALADDAAARRYDRRTVGIELGRIALTAYPPAGLGASGAALWRVQRLLAPAKSPPQAALLASVTALLATGLTIVLADTVQALGRVANAQFCPV